MMRLVLGLEALQDLEGFADSRLDDIDLLEPTRQRTVLFEDAAIFLERGRADAAQLARRQRGLDQVGGVHGATRRRAGTDDGVDLVDEQQRIRHLLQRGQHALETLFEIASILGASHQCTQIQRVDHCIGKHLRHVVVDDALG